MVSLKTKPELEDRASGITNKVIKLKWEWYYRNQSLEMCTKVDKTNVDSDVI